MFDFINAYLKANTGTNTGANTSTEKRSSRTKKSVILSCALAVIFSQSISAKQRIIALAPHIVEMLYDIGVGDSIVATVEYADYPEAALNIPRVGGYHGIQIEKILALKPDLVIAWQSGNPAHDITKLKALGIKVVYSQPDKLADVAKELRYFGQLTHSQNKAEEVAQAFEQRLAKLRQAHQSKLAIPVFYQLWPEPMMTINKTTWIDQLLKICRADNVFAESSTPYPKIGIENVIVAQPHLIILPDEKSDKAQPVINWNKWPEIPAVKKQNFIHVNADLLHRFSTRMLSGVEDLCAQIDQKRGE